MSALKPRAWRLAPYDTPNEKGLTVYFTGSAEDVHRLLLAVPKMLEALQDSESTIEMYLQDLKERDAWIAERDGYGDGYVSNYTKTIEDNLAAVKVAIKEGRVLS